RRALNRQLAQNAPRGPGGPASGGRPQAEGDGKEEKKVIKGEGGKGRVKNVGPGAKGGEKFEGDGEGGGMCGGRRKADQGSGRGGGGGGERRARAAARGGQQGARVFREGARRWWEGQGEGREEVGQAFQPDVLSWHRRPACVGG